MEILKNLARRFGLGPPLHADAVVAAERRYIEAAQARAFDGPHQAYLDGDYRNFVEKGYPDYVKAHYAYLDPGAYPARERPCYGLALSGGGIRSASFAIGVIQALHNQELFDGKPTVFDRLAYLSTVSGGGYTGSALTWYQKRFGVFPFGNIATFAGSQHSRSDENRVLSYIRQHGKYLTPAQLGVASLVGSVLISVIHSIVAYTLLFSLAMLLITLLITTGILHPFLDLTIAHSGTVQSLLELVPRSIAALQDDKISQHRIAFSVFFLSLALLFGALFLLATFVYALSSYLQRQFTHAYCYRVWVQRISGLLLLGLAFSLFFAAVPLAALLVFGATLDFNDPGLFSSMASGLAGVLLSVRQFRLNAEADTTGNGMMEGFIRALTILSTLLLIFLTFLVSYILAETIHEHYQSTGSPVSLLLLLLASLVVPFFVNINQVSPHKMYRDRLMETFLKPPQVAPDAPLCKRGSEANRTTLHEVGDGEHWSPYHLINCNVILNNARTPKYRGRLGDSFLLSALYCGSDATQYVETNQFANGNLTLATAMSISGAAENPHAGVSGGGSSTNPLLSFVLTFLGLRLGFWAFNPSHGLRALQTFVQPNYFFPGLRSLLNYGHGEHSMMVELSDGGHFDNTGLYELVRRRVPVIILSDGGADPGATFDDFGNAIERIRVDFGVSIRFRDPDLNLAGMLPGSQAAASDGGLYDEKYQLAERGYAIGDILYPTVGNEKAFIGRFVYIKTSLTRGLPDDLYAYRMANPSYPNQSTLDQFFDERQFEAYRELGYQLTRQMLTNPQALALMP